MIPIEKLPSVIKDFATLHILAGAIALTRTAKHCQQAAIESLREKFIIRNKWSEKSIKITVATTETMQSEVYVLDKYLADHEEGATRPVKAGGTPIPIEIRAAAKIDEAKVIPQAYRASRLAKGSKPVNKARPFVATANNTTGVWVRSSDKRLPIQLLYALSERPKKIEPRPWFQQPVEEAYDRHLDPEFTRALDEQTTRLLVKYGAG